MTVRILPLLTPYRRANELAGSPPSYAFTGSTNGALT